MSRDLFIHVAQLEVQQNCGGADTGAGLFIPDLMETQHPLIKDRVARIHFNESVGRPVQHPGVNVRELYQ